MQQTVCPRQGRLAHSRQSRWRKRPEVNPRVVRRILDRLCQGWLDKQKGRKRDIMVPFPKRRQLKQEAMAIAGT
jgi:hypothetical protein